MNAATGLAAVSHELLARADPSTESRPPVYKAIGISLAIASGVFIGISFVLKKMGLLKANLKYNEEAGEGYGYLKNAYWWTGMTLMIIGEICNFVAYAFVDAILVTPLGALSVVITTILSAIFLKERLSFVGKIGCFICIIGSIVIVLNAPEQSSAATIQEMQNYVIAPGFLSYTGVVILSCAFIAFWAGPRYGKKTMMVYLSICSLIGGLSVVATQGLGAAVVAQAGGTPQFNQWFLYVLFVFVICTLVTEIIYLNKALNLFNAALVTPTYYVYFTSSTIVSSAILFRGFKGTPISIATIIMGFLQICSGVVLLQLSKSAKDVPDAAVFTGDLDQVRTVAEQEQPESEPKADAIRGAAAIIRRISTSRQKMEAAEAKRVYEDRKRDQMEPINENERVEWDGLRRRKTVIEPDGAGGIQRRKTQHPPLGLTRFPDYDEDEGRPVSGRSNSGNSGTFKGSFLSSFRGRRVNTELPAQSQSMAQRPEDHRASSEPTAEVSIADFKGGDYFGQTGYTHHDSQDMEMNHVYGVPPGLRHPTVGNSQSSSSIAWAPDVKDHMQSKESLAPEVPAHTARRQFSFQNVFRHGHKHDNSSDSQSNARKKLGSRQSSKEHSIPHLKDATEEERLGLVKGDSNSMLPLGDAPFEEEESMNSPIGRDFASASEPALPHTDHDIRAYEAQRQRWAAQGTGGTMDMSTARSLPITPLAPATPNPDRDPEDERRRGSYTGLGLQLDEKEGGGGSFL